VAIAGWVPAGGKSVFTALIAAGVEGAGASVGVAGVGLDGYHYRTATSIRTSRRSAMARCGDTKGRIFTFDAIRLAADLKRLKGGGGAVALPVYDRKGTTRSRGDRGAGLRRLVLIEGNYLLYREGRGPRCFDSFDLRVFLDLPAGVNRERMIARHVRGRRSRGDAHCPFRATRWAEHGRWVAGDRGGPPT